MSEFQFSKNERLKSRKAISSIFENGRSIYSYPVKLLYQTYEDPGDIKFPLKCGFSVAKRNFRRAVDRNLMKRRMREAYRLNKNATIKILRNKKKSANLFFIYISKDKLEYFRVEDSVYRALEQLNEEISSDQMT